MEESQMKIDRFVCKCQIMQQQKKRRQRPGLFIKPAYINQNIIQENILVPLQKVDFNIEIQDGIAKTTYTQVYKNEYPQLLEAEYFFPMDNEVCFESLECEFEGKTVKGIIKEKEIAKKEYKQNKEIGNLVVYAEKTEETPDIMKIDLGNIRQDTEITVKFVYSQELPVQQNKFYMYKIPQGITPRFCENTSDIPEFNKIPMIQKSNHKAFTTSINFDVKSQFPIDFMKSPSHDLLVLYQDDLKTQFRGQVDANGQNLLGDTNSKTFVLLVKSQKIAIPQAILSENEAKKVCAKVTFVPNFNNAEIDDAFRCQIQNQTDNGNFEVDMDSAKSEFIFLLDRSGSMSGQRIEKAKQALILFLKSLPEGSYFNVYSFGSRFDAMFSESALYEEKILENAIDLISQFSANYGGTIIFNPLQKILTQPRKKNYPRQVFLLTDGCVSDPKSVINLIAQNCKNQRVHAIGVGSGASTYLVNECAKKGQGKPVFVGDSEDVSGQIIQLLDTALTPCLDDFSIKFDKEIVESVIPNPENMPIVMKNEPFNMYVYFKDGVKMEELKTNIQLTCFDTKLNGNLQYTVDIDGKENLKNESVYKMGIHKTILALEDGLINGRGYYDDIYFAKQMSATDEIVKISIQNQVLSTRTAYICVVDEPLDEQRNQLLEKGQKKIIVPQIISEEYQQKNNNMMIKKKKCINAKVDSKTQAKLMYLDNDMRKSSNLNSVNLSMQNRQKQQLYRGSVPSVAQNSILKPQMKMQNAIPQKKSEYSLDSFDQRKRKAKQNKIESESESEEIDDEDYDDGIEQVKGVQINDDQCKLKKEQLQDKPNKNKMNVQKLECMELVKKQNLSGFWVFNDQIWNTVCSQNIKDVRDSFNQDISIKLEQQFNNQIQQIQQFLLTLLILAWLEKFQSDKKSNWMLIHRKGVQWINKQNIGKYTELIKNINNFIQQ